MTEDNMGDTDSPGVRRITRRELEENGRDGRELVIVHTDDDPDECYHDFREGGVNRLNVALGTLTTAESAEANGYTRCTECYTQEDT